MQIIRYKDPYAKARNGSPVDIIIEEDMPPERLREVQDYLNEDFTRVRSSMRKYERHNLSLESRLYEGPDFSYRKTPEWICLRKEQREEMAAALASLTETQYRRFGMLCDGLSVREIARIEEADYKSVRESIEAARKKLRCAIESCTIEEPDFDCHQSKHKHRKTVMTRIRRAMMTGFYKSPPSKRYPNVGMVRGTIIPRIGGEKNGQHERTQGAVHLGLLESAGKGRAHDESALLCRRKGYRHK